MRAGNDSAARHSRQAVVIPLGDAPEQRSMTGHVVRLQRTSRACARTVSRPACRLSMGRNLPLKARPSENRSRGWVGQLGWRGERRRVNAVKCAGSCRRGFDLGAGRAL
eukprot:646118-Pyramimonas_sp.AAC.1